MHGGLREAEWMAEGRGGRSSRREERGAAEGGQGGGTAGTAWEQFLRAGSGKWIF